MTSSFEDKLKVLMKYPEMLDFIDVLIDGAKKHGDENWLKPDGNKQSIRDNCNSITHHVLDVRAGVEKDKDSGLNPELHAMCRLAMLHVRRVRGIVHSTDLKYTSGICDGMYNGSGSRMTQAAYEKEGLLPTHCVGDICVCNKGK